MYKATEQQSQAFREVHDAVSELGAPLHNDQDQDVIRLALRGPDWKAPSPHHRVQTYRPAINIDARRANQGHVIEVDSPEQYIWGDPNTGARFGLPVIPLDIQSRACRALRDTLGCTVFPAERLRVGIDPDNSVTVSTHDAHGQFDYQRFESKEGLARFKRRFWRARFPLKVGDGMIDFTDRRALRLDAEHADDLERQLLDGTIEMIVRLIAGNAQSVSAPEWGDAVTSVCDEVEKRFRQIATPVPEART